MTRPGWRTLATLALVALLSGCDRGAEARAPETAHQPVAPAVVAPPLPAGLECLRADSLRTHGDSLRYTNLTVHEETGDLLGKDVRLVHRGESWSGSIALAQGQLGMATPFRLVTFDPPSGNLSLSWDYDERPASFMGKLTCASIIGALRWDTTGDAETDTLKREPDVK